jgi:hypothetical protein
MAPDKTPVKAGELLPLQRPSDLAHAGARMQPERDDREAACARPQLY